MRRERIKRWTASPRTLHIVNLIALACLVVFVLWLMVWVLSLSNEAQVASAANTRQDAALYEANRRIVAAGGTPVEVPPAPAPVKGDQGPQGFPGLNGIAGLSGLQGITGPAGRNGANATSSQVAQAVNAFCSSRGDCSGPAGPAGKNGSDGRDSTTPGPQGAKGDAGPAGKVGAAGKDGADGADAYPMTWTFTVQTNPLQSQTFTCTLTNPSATSTCEEVPQ